MAAKAARAEKVAAANDKKAALAAEQVKAATAKTTAMANRPAITKAEITGKIRVEGGVRRRKARLTDPKYGDCHMLQQTMNVLALPRTRTPVGDHDDMCPVKRTLQKRLHFPKHTLGKEGTWCYRSLADAGRLSA